jgi:hypothetical protein
MALQTPALNAASDGVAGVADQMSLHTADPTSVGDNEVSGGGYSRQSVTWDPATGAVATADGTVSFSGPSEQAITHVGLWDSSGPTWLGGEVPTGDLAFNAAGELDVTTATITGAAG